MRILNYHEQIKGLGKHILLCENDKRIISAVRTLKDEGEIEPVLLGDRALFEETALSAGLSLADITIIPIEPDRFAQKYFDIRKHKGISFDDALKSVSDPAVYGCLLLDSGQVDGLVCGCTWPTSNTLRAALQILRKGLAFSYFIMRAGQGDYLFADCAFNIQPSAQELSQIAYGAGLEAEWIGLKPRIALLSFSTYGSASHPDQKKVSVATALLLSRIKEEGKDWVVGGEIQVDTAMDPETAMIKAPNSPLKGNATVMIFPDLDAANIGYKLVQRFTHCEAIGPLISGFRKPVNDLSRGASVQDIIDTCYLTAWQSLHIQ